MRFCLIVGAALMLFLVIGCGAASPPTSPTPTVPAPDPPLPALSPDVGDTWVRPADGMSMVYVPGGTFQMGSVESDGLAGENESPAHTVTLDSFWIDQTEVANAQYSQCVDEGSCRASVYARDTTYNEPHLPAVGVGWQEAVDYCTWMGGRLPTEAEWEYAARGEEEHIYPWGDVFEGMRLNYCDASCDEGDWADEAVDDGYVRSAPVGTFPDGASWVGALDLAGNVWEWVADWYGDYPSEPQTNPVGPETGWDRILRGGCWANDLGGVRGTYRLRMASASRHPNIGFRCVISAANLTGLHQ